MKKIISVIGGRRVERSLLEEAEKVGRLIARNGIALVCGGLGGVMEAVSRGAKAEGGLTLGILPKEHKRDANEYIDFPVVTGMGIGRNVIISRTADVVIAIGGEYGTLSEIAFALQLGKPVIGIGTWEIKGIIKTDNAEDAMSKALELLGS